MPPEGQRKVNPTSDICCHSPKHMLYSRFRQLKKSKVAKPLIYRDYATFLIPSILITSMFCSDYLPFVFDSHSQIEETTAKHINYRLFRPFRVQYILCDTMPERTDFLR